MVTRVLDRAGNVVHDCDESGCDTSWDGYVILRASGKLTQGQPVEGRSDPDAATWRITGTEARAL